MATVEQIEGRIAALEASIASGVLTVTHDGVTTTYRSYVEMQRTLSWLKGELAKAQGRAGRRVRYAYQSGKGL